MDQRRPYTRTRIAGRIKGVSAHGYNLGNRGNYYERLAEWAMMGDD